MSLKYGERDLARLRYETWMRSLNLMTKVVIAMTVVTVISVITAIWTLNSKPEPRYFATQENGGILPLIPLSNPYLSDGEVINFAVEAITRSLTMDFANWRSDLSGAKKYFDHPQGWNSFLDAVNNSGMLDYIRENRLVSTAVANGAVIVRTGENDNDQFVWTVHIPLIITYESASELSRDNLLAEVELSRLPTWKIPQAVGISRIVVRPGKASEIQ